MLSLAEELMLLALKDDKGSVVFSASTALPYGLAGALLMDLVFQERIALSEGKVQLVDTVSTNNPLLDETLDLIRQDTKSRKTGEWVRRIHGKVKDIDKRITDQLVTKKILKHQKTKVLWVFNVERYPTLDSVPELAIRARIKGIIFENKPYIARDIALISLIKACDLVDEVFGSEGRKVAKQKIKEISEDEAIGKAITQVVEEIIMMIIITTTVTTTVVTS